MAKVYQPIESEKWIPHNLYMAIIYHIRDYDRQKAELEGYRQSSDKGRNPTEKKGVKLAQMSRMISAIDHAIETVPEEYRSGIWEHIVNDKPYPDYAGAKTWRRWKLVLIRKIGENLGYLEQM